MSNIDFGIMALYFIILLGVGLYHSRGHETEEDYFLGGRKIKSWHVGVSVVATDVGGGFSIGLAGLGFTLGLSASWMLFTGLIGAWLSAVLLIPKIKVLEKAKRFSTFNDVISYFYGKKTALLATIISLIGYLGFTSSQLLAGAKLTNATVSTISFDQALWAMGIITVLYTAFGGIKAVIYTDTFQWILLMGGLLLVGIPMTVMNLGGWEQVMSVLPPAHMSFTQVSFSDIINWGLTIIPVWFIGLTLYQRIYTCNNEKEAKKAWYLAGLLEWPIMAFMGTMLGILARVAYDTNQLAPVGFPSGSEIDVEMALPLLLTQSLHSGFLGLMLAAYFSAILSTADSCLMASSQSFISDLLKRHSFFQGKDVVRLCQLATFLLGIFALILASRFENVLNLMLLSYGVMVSGLFIPVMGGLFLKKTYPIQGFLSIIAGGGVSLYLNLNDFPGLPIVWGLTSSLAGFLLGALLLKLSPKMVSAPAVVINTNDNDPQ